MSTAVGMEGLPAKVALGSDPYCPHPAVLKAVELESPGVATFSVEFLDPKLQAEFRYLPGQFNMVGLPRVGEVPISISGTPGEGMALRHTIRFVGRVTDTVRELRPGAFVLLRGPYGSHWPVERAEGLDVVLVAGGLGLAPLRPAVKALLANRGKYGRLTLIYGARQPADLLFTAEYDAWQRQGMEMLVTVDHADASWRGRVGVAPLLFRKIAIDPARTVVMTCGPEIMMKYAIQESLARRVPKRDTYVSLERNMQCAVGLCGHCQFGPLFLCTNGPVFSYDAIERFFGKEHF